MLDRLALIAKLCRYKYVGYLRRLKPVTRAWTDIGGTWIESKIKLE